MGVCFLSQTPQKLLLNVLFKAAQKSNVIIRTEAPVKTVSRSFTVFLKNGEELECDHLLIATGSNPLGYRWAKDLGHQIEVPVPSLFTFNIRDSRLEGLAGVSVESVSIRLLDTGKTTLEQQGPLLITHWGISGPAVLKLSAWAARLLYEHKYKCLYN